MWGGSRCRPLTRKAAVCPSLSESSESTAGQSGGERRREMGLPPSPRPLSESVRVFPSLSESVRVCPSLSESWVDLPGPPPSVPPTVRSGARAGMHMRGGEPESRTGRARMGDGSHEVLATIARSIGGGSREESPHVTRQGSPIRGSKGAKALGEAWSAGSPIRARREALLHGARDTVRQVRLHGGEPESRAGRARLRGPRGAARACSRAVGAYQCCHSCLRGLLAACIMIDA